jgi:hypothetical protein
LHNALLPFVRAIDYLTSVAVVDIWSIVIHTFKDFSLWASFYRPEKKPSQR